MLATTARSREVKSAGDPAATQKFVDSEFTPLVAAYLKAGRRTVYRLAANGQIPAFKLGGVWRFRRAELERWIAARIGTQEEKPKPDEGKP